MEPACSLERLASVIDTCRVDASCLASVVVPCSLDFHVSVVAVARTPFLPC